MIITDCFKKQVMQGQMPAPPAFETASTHFLSAAAGLTYSTVAVLRNASNDVLPDPTSSSSFFDAVTTSLLGMRRR